MGTKTVAPSAAEALDDRFHPNVLFGMAHRDQMLPRAGADLRLLQKAMGYASITVTAHTYADLFDDELDNIAAALDSLDDLSQAT